MAQPRKPASRRTKVLVGLAALAVGWGASSFATGGQVADWVGAIEDRAKRRRSAELLEEFHESLPKELLARAQALIDSADDAPPISAEGRAMLDLASDLLSDLRRGGLGPDGMRAIDALAAWHETYPGPTAGYVEEEWGAHWPSPRVFQDDYQSMLRDEVPGDHPYWIAAGRIALEYSQASALDPDTGSVVLGRLVANGAAGREVLRHWLPSAPDMLRSNVAYLTAEAVKGAEVSVLAFGLYGDLEGLSPQEAAHRLETEVALLADFTTIDAESTDWESQWAGVFSDTETARTTGRLRPLTRIVVPYSCAARERLARVEDWLAAPTEPFPSMEVDEERIERLLFGLPEDGEGED